ncbi:hypothetical protein C7B61_16190 [filamentous cyanobacterium CCP1]|nr:hypothetical protein C7B61_16190 [filamentous cyanobacterium CCP1]
MTQTQMLRLTLTSISQRINLSGDGKGAIVGVECAVERGLGSSGMGSAIGNNIGFVGAESLQGGSLQAGFMRGGFARGSFMHGGFMHGDSMQDAEGSAKFGGGVVLVDRHNLSIQDLSVRDLPLQDWPIRHQLGGLLPAQRSGRDRCNLFCNPTVPTQD